MFDDLIAAASAETGVPESWIQAVIQVESAWNPDAVGASGEIGLMQLLPSTACDFGICSQLADPWRNILAGSRFLAHWISKVGLDPKRVYSAYNSGNPDAYLTSPTVAAHVQKFMDALATYAGPLAGGASILLIALAVWLFLRKGRQD